ncbi:MAG: prolipoprotein diacylglyceryl transferase [Sphaerochaetaceae bacterium]|nr:prolipoprotein diacylglyceryl transferase [Sphaerochaetaceae bacterium]
MATYIAFPSWISPTVFPSLPIRWYSLMYLVAFAITYLLVMLQRKKGKISISNDDTLTLFLYAITGLILGARLFSTLLYEGSFFYWMNPHLIFWPFRNGQFIGLPGMSYHGGLVGVVLAVALFAKRYRFNFLHLGDILVTAIPLGYTFGRLGNFINGELWGKVSTLPWAITFPLAQRFPENETWVREIATSIGLEYSSGALINLPRHPSQLYEALFEGVVLFLFLYFIIQPRRNREGQSVAWYLIGYGTARFCIEYLREPDRQLGYIIGDGPTMLFTSLLNISMGQLLSFLMVTAGVGLLFFSRYLAVRKQEKAAQAALAAAAARSAAQNRKKRRKKTR